MEICAIVFFFLNWGIRNVEDCSREIIYFTLFIEEENIVGDTTKVGNIFFQLNMNTIKYYYFI